MKPKKQIKNGYRVGNKLITFPWETKDEKFNHYELKEWIHQNYYDKFIDPDTKNGDTYI